MSVNKDKREPLAAGTTPSRRTVVGVPALPGSDGAARSGGATGGRDDEDGPTNVDMKAVTPIDADRVLSDKPPAVAGAVSAKTAPLPTEKMPAVSAEMFRGMRRPAGTPIDPERKTSAGVAPQPGIAPKGRSTLLLDGSAPPVAPGDANDDRPPIVVPASARKPPKAITQPPNWSQEAAHPPHRIPRAPAVPGAELSAEEISASLLVPDDVAPRSPSNEAEELSGSLLVEDAPAGQKPRVTVKPPVPGSVRPRPASVKPPLPRGPASGRPPSSKPPLPRTRSRPPSKPPPFRSPSRPPPLKVPSNGPGHEVHARAVGGPADPKTLTAVEGGAVTSDGLPPPPFTDAVYDLPTVIPVPAGVESLAPVAPASTSLPSSPPSPSQRAPAAKPTTGDIEVTTLPRNAVAQYFAELQPFAQKIVADLRRRIGPRGGQRPRWFIPVVAVGGLVVGVGVVGLTVSMAKGGARSEAGDAPTRGPGQPSAAASQTTRAAPATSASASPPANQTASFTACTVNGAPHVIAPSAIVTAGVEAAANGTDLAIGFAPSDHDATALRVNPARGAIGAPAQAHVRDAVRRVTPILGRAGVLSIVVDTDTKDDKLQARRTVRSVTALQMGKADDGQLAWAKIGGGVAGRLWSLEATNGTIDALRGEVDGSGDPTMAVAFRSGGAVWMGTATGTDELSPEGTLSHVDGLGTTVGSPAVAISQRVALVAWADRASNDVPWQLRWARFAAGSPPETARAFSPPPGGKGEPFMSPALAAVPGGRFLLLWTEGPASGHVVRALTLAPDGSPLGGPLDLSPDGANAGQAQAAVTQAGEGVVAFLQSAGSGFEVATTSIHCDVH